LSGKRWSAFSAVHEIFDELRSLLIGVAGGLIDEAEKLPTFIAEVFAKEEPAGVHRLSLTIELPEGWTDAVKVALERATTRLMDDWEA
jgi:hypothetical protein